MDIGRKWEYQKKKKKKKKRETESLRSATLNSAIRTNYFKQKKSIIRNRIVGLSYVEKEMK